jgi:hypothetical protein
MPYKCGEKLFREELHIDVSDSYLHSLTDYAGGKMLLEDKKAAKEWERMLSSGKGAAAKADVILAKPTREGVFYIMIDGSMLNMRDSQDESSWKEVKLGLFFAAGDAKKRGKEETVSIVKKDYAVWLWDVKTFAYHVLAAAERNHCYEYEQIMVISDGSAWIREMCKDLFPCAVQILDYWHITENIYGFGRYLFNDDEGLYKPWAEALIERLKSGDAGEIATVVSELK